MKESIWNIVMVLIAVVGWTIILAAFIHELTPDINREEFDEYEEHNKNKEDEFDKYHPNDNG